METGLQQRNLLYPFQKLWIDVICRIKGGNTLPLLSAPTHTPAYIQATELIQRLAAYQQAGTKPNTWDFQLAIARCAMEDKEEAIATARQLLKDEYLHLFLFLLDEDTHPEPPYNYQPVWITAGLVKSPETEFKAFKSFSCNILSHNYLSGRLQMERTETEREIIRYRQTPATTGVLQMARICRTKQPSIMAGASNYQQ